MSEPIDVDEVHCVLFALPLMHQVVREMEQAVKTCDQADFDASTWSNALINVATLLRAKSVQLVLSGDRFEPAPTPEPEPEP